MYLGLGFAACPCFLHTCTYSRNQNTYIHTYIYTCSHVYTYAHTYISVFSLEYKSSGYNHTHLNYVAAYTHV